MKDKGIIMSVVTAQMVKELRDATLAGMSDCKRALDAAEGSMEKALVFLREKGLASAAKKSDRATTEGVVSAVVKDHSRGYLFELNCETDFVTKNDGFQKFVNSLENVVSTQEPKSLDEFLASKQENGQTVQESTLSLVATVGENIQLNRYECVGSGSNFVASYTHGGGRIAVLVELSADGISDHKDKPELSEIAHNAALQAAAMKPSYLSAESVPPETVKAEEEIIRNKFIKQGKPEKALDKIVPSSLKSWFKESCLAEQAYVKDDSKTVAAYVADSGNKIGLTNLHLTAFVRVELGGKA